MTLREELDAVDEYLDIERVRFGPSLVVDKTLDEGSLDIMVPSMILQPLVENSIKHGLARKVGEGRVSIRASRHGGHAVIEVADNGRGIAPEDHQRVFDLFRRAGQQDQPGEGIGLAHVRTLVRNLGGDITLDSEFGRGTTFNIVLPADVRTVMRSINS